jgi:hypothetical protein
MERGRRTLSTLCAPFRVASAVGRTAKVKLGQRCPQYQLDETAICEPEALRNLDLG